MYSYPVTVVLIFGFGFHQIIGDGLSSLLLTEVKEIFFVTALLLFIATPYKNVLPKPLVYPR